VSLRLEKQAEHGTRVVIVLDHENAPTRRWRRSPREGPGESCWARDSRQSNGELAPSTRSFARCGQRAAVQFHEHPRQAQSDPEATLHAARRLLSLNEHLEDLAQSLG